MGLYDYPPNETIKRWKCRRSWRILFFLV